MNLTPFVDFLAVFALGLAVPSIISIFRVWKSTGHKFLLYFGIYLTILNFYFLLLVGPILVSTPIWSGPWIKHLRIFSLVSYIFILLTVDALTTNKHVSRYKNIYFGIFFVLTFLLVDNNYNLLGIWTFPQASFLLGVFAYLLDLWIAAVLIILSNTLRNGARKASFIFGIYMFASGLILLISTSLSYFEVITVQVSTIAYFLVTLVQNAAPFLFLGAFMRMYGGRSSEKTLLTQLNLENARKINLTKRESEIAGLICQGLSNQEIADKLFISSKTVKAHIYTIYKKADVSNRVQLTLLLQNKS